MTFGNITVDSSHIKAITRPNKKMKPFEMHHRNEDVSYPGKISYEPMTLVFYSHAGKTLREIRRWFNERSYNIDESKNLDNPDNRADVMLDEVDGFGNSTYRYSMLGAYIAERSGSPADYADNNISEVIVVVRFNKLTEIDIGESIQSTDPECSVDGGSDGEND